MKTNELWNDYFPNGELRKTPRPVALGNPDCEEDSIVGTVLILFYRKNPATNSFEVLFQKRSPLVDHNAGKWDYSAGGHINFNESPLAAALRETKEEIGVSLAESELEFLATLKASFKKNMFLNCYLSDRTGKPDVFNFNDEEVSEVKWVPFPEFDNFIDEFCKSSIKNGKLTRKIFKKWLKSKNGTD